MFQCFRKVISESEVALRIEDTSQCRRTKSMMEGNNGNLQFCNPVYLYIHIFGKDSATSFKYL